MWLNFTPDINTVFDELKLVAPVAHDEAEHGHHRGVGHAEEVGRLLDELADHQAEKQEEEHVLVDLKFLFFGLVRSVVDFSQILHRLLLQLL